MRLLNLGNLEIFGRTFYYERYHIFRIAITTVLLMAIINFDVRQFWVVFVVSIIITSFSYKITDYVRREAENRRIKTNMQKDYELR